MLVVTHLLIFQTATNFFFSVFFQALSCNDICLILWLLVFAVLAQVPPQQCWPPLHCTPWVTTDPLWKWWWSQGRLVCEGMMPPKQGWGERLLGEVRERNQGLDTVRHSSAQSKLTYRTGDPDGCWSWSWGQNCSHFIPLHKSQQKDSQTYRIQHCRN